MMQEFLNFLVAVHNYYSIAFDIKSKNLAAYCSGSTVDIPSTSLDPYLTVLATLAACFLTPY